MARTGELMMSRDRLVTYTLFESVTPREKVERADVSWSELVARIESAATYIDKKHCPLISMAEYGETLSDNGYIRHALNVKRIFGVELDYDGEQMPLAIAAAKLDEAGIEAMLYTSPSHKPTAPRWRALFPLAEPALPEERGVLVARANRILGGVASRESFTLSQSFYIGRVRGAEYETTQTRGRCIDEALDVEPLFFVGQGGGGETRKDLTTDAELRAAFDRGEDRYQAMLKLSARWAARGMAEDDIAAALEALFGDGPSINGDGIDLRQRIPAIARSAAAKFGETRRRGYYEPDDEPPPDEPPPWLEDYDTEDRAPDAPGELEEAESRPERRPLDWSELSDQQPPAREWAIPHWLGIGYVTLLAGPGGVGKSLLAQQLASSLATGENFIEPLERARRVLMWAGEDDRDELWRRQASIASYTGRALSDYGDLIIESYAGRDCTLATTVFGAITATKMLEELAEQVADYDADVVFLDNIARLFGGNENERHHVTLFVNLIAGACNRKKPTAVVLLGHPAKAEGSEWAGSTAWEAAVRSRWYFGRTLPDAQEGAEEGDPDVRYLARRKSNYSGLDALQMRYDNTKHVIVPDVTKATERGLHPSRAETLVLEALESFVKQGISTSDERRNPQFLPRVMVDRKLATRPMIPQLTDALYRLQKAGRITRQQVGVYANRSPRMGLGVA